jgi:hypothetical protein
MVVKVKLVAAERSYLGGKHVAAQVTAIGQHGFPGAVASLTPKQW